MTLSLLALFDDIVRCNSVLRNSGCETEFIEFARNQEECRLQWMKVEQECQRLQLALEKANHEASSLEGNLRHARRLLDQERKKRKQAEVDCDRYEKQLGMVRDLVFCGETRNKLNDETKEKLAFLNNTTMRSRASFDQPTRLNTITEALDSTGSLLSDMSYSRSEDDLDVSHRLNDSHWRKHKSTVPPDDGEHLPKRCRSSTRKSLDVITNERLVATTVVTMAREGHIRARSSIEAVPAEPPLSHQLRSGTEWKTPTVTHTRNKAYAPQPPYNPEVPLSNAASTTTSESETEVLWPPSEPKRPVDTTPQNTGPHMSNFASGKINSRVHSFVSKTLLRPEMCGPCGKRIRFGKMTWRCVDCRASCHANCRDLVPLPCVPLANTPTQRAGGYVIADYAPTEPPMVPALIVHCVNEIESRGMNEVGLYRVPGSERDVKSLKERFLRQKGVPPLSSTDVHVLCGVVKDFLRCLREQLLTQNLWSDFVKALEHPYDSDKKAALYQAISELPQPNRDTLAFLMLHLQRVAECKDCKMPISNLAKVFGPTLLGYSSSNISPQDILTETRLQAGVIELLLNIESHYYLRYLESGTPVTRLVTRTPSSRSFFTPGSRTLRRKGQKFFNTPPFMKND